MYLLLYQKVSYFQEVFSQKKETKLILLQSVEIRKKSLYDKNFVKLIFLLKNLIKIGFTKYLLLDDSEVLDFNTQH